MRFSAVYVAALLALTVVTPEFTYACGFGICPTYGSDYYAGGPSYSPFVGMPFVGGYSTFGGNGSYGSSSVFGSPYMTGQMGYTSPQSQWDNYWAWNGSTPLGVGNYTPPIGLQLIDNRLSWSAF